jgi:hypothetical protein
MLADRGSDRVSSVAVNEQLGTAALVADVTEFGCKVTYGGIWSLQLPSEA